MPGLTSDSRNESTSYSQCAYNIARTVASVAGPALIAYFAAPYLALATRAVFPAAYALVIGPPSTFGYYTTHIPAREAACNFVYNNSHIIVGGASVTAQAAKNAISCVSKCRAGFFTSKPNSPNEEQSIHPAIENSL